MLKDGLPLPSIGLYSSMRGSKCLFHMFGLTHTHLAELMNSAIMDRPSIVFKRHAEAGTTTIQMAVYVYVLFRGPVSHVWPNPFPTDQAEEQHNHEPSNMFKKHTEAGATTIRMSTYGI